MICNLCFVPVMMTSLSTISEVRENPKSVSASADATLTLSGGVSVGSVLRLVNGYGDVSGAGGCFLRTRSLCTLLTICWSNEQIYAGFRVKVVQLVPEWFINGRERWGNETATGELHGIIHKC